MQVLLNSSKVLWEHGPLVLKALGLVAWGALIALAILKRLANAAYSDASLAALALAGWTAPALGISGLFFLLCRLLPYNMAVLLALALAGVSAGLAIVSLWGRASAEALLPVLIFLLVMAARLGYSADLILPPYFDSAEHYRIIDALVKVEHGAAFAWPTSTYYHVGYHMITAMLASLTSEPLAQVMLVFGQVLLSALPLPICFFVYRATGSRAAALFSVALAAFGWSMPAHAVNWGKYPALLGLLAVQFALGAALLQRPKTAAAGAAAAVLIHTRTLLLMIITAVAWLAARFRPRILAVIAASLLGTESFVLWRDAVLGAVLEPYIVWVTLFVGLLAIVGTWGHPRAGASALLATAGILAAMFIPLTPALPLMDRPLAEMSLFFPLAFLGGLGAGRLPRLVVAVLGVAVALHAWTTYSFSPSPCCQLAGADDAVALDWIGKNLPAEARIGIASTDISLTSSGAPMRGTGTDAGIWVTPLTGRPTVALPYVLDLSRTETHQLLCRQHVDYIYVGGRDTSFKPSELAGLPEWYGIVFALPHAQVVRVQGCR